MAPVRPFSASGESFDGGDSMHMEDLGNKAWGNSTDTLTRLETREVYDAEGVGREPVVARTEDIALKALHTDDDASLNPWTFRMFFLGSPRHSENPSSGCRITLTDRQGWVFPPLVQLWPRSSSSSRSPSRSQSSSSLSSAMSAETGSLPLFLKLVSSVAG